MKIPYKAKKIVLTVDEQRFIFPTNIFPLSDNTFFYLRYYNM